MSRAQLKYLSIIYYAVRARCCIALYETITRGCKRTLYSSGTTMRVLKNNVNKRADCTRAVDDMGCNHRPWFRTTGPLQCGPASLSRRYSKRNKQRNKRERERESAVNEKQIGYSVSRCPGNGSPAMIGSVSVAMVCLITIETSLRSWRCPRRCSRSVLVVAAHGGRWGSA